MRYLIKKIRQIREARIRRIVREEMKNHSTMSSIELEEWFEKTMTKIIKNVSLKY